MGKILKIFLLVMFFISFLLLVVVTVLVGSLGGTSMRDDGPSHVNWKTKENVSLNGVRQTTLDGLQDLADWYKTRTGVDLLVTSGTDGSMHAGGTRGSHYSGDKLDVASDYLENPEFRQEFIAYANSRGVIVLDEYDHPSINSTGGHLDLNFENYHRIRK